MSAQARPQDFARAVFDLALEAWTQPLASLRRALKADAALHATVTDTATPVAERLALLDRTLPGGLSGDLRKFVGTLLESGALDQLDGILAEIDRLAQRGPERRLAHVSSAVSLTTAEKDALRSKLVSRFGSDLEFQFDVDPGLLGGVLLRVGDQVIDGTVAGRLAAMRDRLSS